MHRHAFRRAVQPLADRGLSGSRRVPSFADRRRVVSRFPARARRRNHCCDAAAMNVRLLKLPLTGETDIVLARKRTRRIAELIGFDSQDQTRITTATSEIARNALEHAKGGAV